MSVLNPTFWVKRNLLASFYCLLHAPSCFDSSEARPNDPNSQHNSCHPYSGTKSGHYQVRGEVEDDVSNIEQCECSGSLLGGQMKDLLEIVTRRFIHCLCETDIGTNGRAEEV